MTYRLGFIGCGNMAQAIAGGAIKQGVLAAGSVIASDPSEANRAVFADWGCAVSEHNSQVIGQAEQVLLAVKPQIFPKVAPQLAEHEGADQVLISIMAGLSSAKIESLIGRPRRIVRVMPNTPALVGLGMAGVALAKNARAGDDVLAFELFESVGQAVKIEESQIDAITAVSGSGPAYLFYLAEAMEKAAYELGVGEYARQLVGQTMLGAAKLLVDSGEPPEELRRKVTSPGGTTAAAIAVMEEHAMQRTIVDALHANVKRSEELGG